MILFEYIQYFIEYLFRDPFTQVTGFMWMAVILTAYFQKDDRTVKKLMLLSSLFWGTHFYLLGVYSGLAATVIWIFRLLLSMKYQKNKYAFWSIVVLTVVIWYFTVDWLFSLLPILTSLNWAYSFFFLEKIKLRIAMLLNSATWLVYHVSIWSISWIINESFTQVILIMTVYRMMHPEGWSKYYAQKIKDILWKTSHPDYDRFIFIRDKVSQYRSQLWINFQKILHHDLRTFFKHKKKAGPALNILQKKEVWVINSALKNLQTKK